MGGSLFGLPGMVVGVPVFAVLYTLVRQMTYNPVSYTHLDVYKRQLLGQLPGAESGCIAFHRHPHLGNGLLGREALANVDASPAVTGMHGGAGDDQISNAGQSRKGLAFGAHGHPQTGDFRNTPVSYTHLDVYKRQVFYRRPSFPG